MYGEVATREIAVAPLHQSVAEPISCLQFSTGLEVLWAGSASGGLYTLHCQAALQRYSCVRAHESRVHDMCGLGNGVLSLSSDRWRCHSALEQGVAQMQESAQTWEAEAQENLQHMDQLKTLLEESAFWQSQSAEPSTSEAQLQKEVLQEKARATGLEVQIRALCLELAHARENAGLLSQSIAPTLGNIGSRIVQLLQVKAVQQAVR